MTHRHMDSSTGKCLLRTFVLVICLGTVDAVSAQDEHSLNDHHDRLLPAAMQDRFALEHQNAVSDSDLATIAGQGAPAFSSIVQPQLGVILWDESDVSKGSRNKSSHSGAVTIQIRMEGF